MIVHVPGATVLTTGPEIVHTPTVSEVSVTGKPEEADAVSVTWRSTLVPSGAGKVIVWVAPPAEPALTWSDCVMGVADA